MNNVCNHIRYLEYEPHVIYLMFRFEETKKGRLTLNILRLPVCEFYHNSANLLIPRLGFLKGGGTVAERHARSTSDPRVPGSNPG